MSHLAGNPPSPLPDTAPPLRPTRILASHEEAITAARTLADQARAGAAERDRERQLPWAEVEAFTAAGLGSISVPRAFGGPQLSFTTVAEVFRLIASADPSLAQIPQNHFGLLQLLREAASPAQQQRLFSAVLEGARIGNAGPERNTRDTLTLATRLAPREDALYVSGEKFYSTGALFAHWVTVKALDAQDRQVIAFVPRGTPGLEVIDDWSGFGQRTTASGSVRLTDLRLDPNLIIEQWRLADRPNLQGAVSQLIQAAIDAGIAEAALTDAIAFVREKSRPWAEANIERASDDPYVIADVGRLTVEVHAANALLHKAAQVLDEVDASGVDADSAARASIAVAKAKALTSEIAVLASEKLFELAGSRATLAEFNLDRHWRNARVHTLHDPLRWKYHAIGAWHLNGTHPARHSWI